LFEKGAGKGKIIYTIQYKNNIIKSVRRQRMPLVTLHALTKTIQRKLNINEKEARQYAEIVMDMFGYDDCIIDNILDHADRRLFYRLESEGILHTRRDEALLSDGTNWRIRYWVFQKNVIFPSESKKKVKNTRSKNKTIPSYKPQSVYSSLPETAWTTRKTHII
jgi:hypothetical protein